MKRLLTLTLLIISLQFSFAQLQFGASILNIKASDNSLIKVSMDGKEVARANNVVTLQNIAPGRHFLNITRYSPALYNPSTIVLYSGPIDISANTEAYYTVLSGMNKIKLDNIIALNNAPAFPAARPFPKPLYPAQVVPPVECAPVYVPAGPMAMNQYDFEQLKRTLGNASFESTRMQILKQALPYNYFTTAQVRQLMNQFWFESSKLEVAKAAYTKTIDQYNYYLVKNEFSFGSSVRDLGDYLAMN